MSRSNHVIDRIGEDESVGRLRALESENHAPYFRVVESTTAPVVHIEGHEALMLGSANYLGLAEHPAVIQGARDALDRYGTTITGSRLLNGTIDLHLALEAEIADWYRTEAAIVFTTGYQANLGAIGALVGPGDTVVVDASAHASILDGCRLSRAKIRMFRHNRLDKLEDTLKRAAGDGGGVLVAVDGLYSMKGDLAPLDGIAALCREYGAALLVDEAHSAGVLGERRTGAAELFGVNADVDVQMGALSKGLGSTGGFVAGSRDVIDALRAGARSFLFTTAAVPSSLGAALAAVRLQRSEEGRAIAERTLANARQLWEGLRDAGFDVGEPSRLPSGEEIVSPIVPVLVGDDLRAATLWRRLFDSGLFASAAMFPAVARSEALLRLCVMATHTREQIDRAVKTFADVAAELPR
ncbi:aminotransferase class I/II-fold pyridoxal phosphate-dependent enzyme [Amycolatopsis alba]|uniref:8-amino-7-oxononanoate synthase n=1 Tax=Amycolatopsis alba DSM 44262 TaxID=1125972 RepID=A0A229RF43_AMYAL|nr:aminotransferase class I/II-fold pyridoxal phosphate-dependent enzyme [Amycolatopsis alba]OXM45205.1 aminotransferase [Amycolatopsis alba DSM 44262]